MEPNPLLDKIDALATGATLSPAKVARHLDTLLRPAEEHSTEYTLIFTGDSDAAGMVESVELRVPGSRRPDGSQLLILTVSRDRCVNESEIIARYGHGELSLPTPRQPQDSPVYRVYPKSWGKISFGIARDGSDCLRTVIIDVKANANDQAKR